MLASSDGISTWTPLKPQHSNPNPLVNQLWCIAFLTPPTPLIIPHRIPAFLESLMPLKNWCQLWQSGFSRVYFNCCCSCLFEREIIKIGQLSHKMYSNNILNFQESMTILNACTISLETYWMHNVTRGTGLEMNSVLIKMVSSLN